MEDDFEERRTIGEDNNKKFKLPCSHCRSNNLQTVATSVCIYTKEGFVDVDTRHLTMQCDGCGTLSFCIRTHYDDVDIDEDPVTREIIAKEPPIYIEQYPQFDMRFVQPQFYKTVPDQVRTVRKETYTALSLGSKKLASIGMRTIIETICAENRITDDIAYSLPNKIKELCNRHFISPGLEKVLLSIKEFGDLGAHTSYIPSIEELKVAWEAIESLFTYLYGAEDMQAKTANMQAFSKRMRKRAA